MHQQFRHSPEERANAYMVWAYEQERNLKATSQILDIPLRTMAYWKRVDEWDKKYKEETQGLATIAFEAAIDDLQFGMTAIAKQIVADATNMDLEHHERMASQKLFLSLFNPEQSGPSILTLIDARSINPSLAGSSFSTTPNTIDQSSASSINHSRQASKILEANVVDALAQQTKSKSKR